MIAVGEAIKSYFADWYDKQHGRVGCLYWLVLAGTSECRSLQWFMFKIQLEWFLFHSLVKVW